MCKNENKQNTKEVGSSNKFSKKRENHTCFFILRNEPIWRFFMLYSWKNIIICLIFQPYPCKKLSRHTGSRGGRINTFTSNRASNSRELGIKMMYWHANYLPLDAYSIVYANDNNCSDWNQVWLRATSYIIIYLLYTINPCNIRKCKR